MLPVEDKANTLVEGSFSVAAITFLQQSLMTTIPWLFVMFAVIITDLGFALRRCYLMGEEVRISRAVRATMGKTVTYVSFVLMVCMIEVAMDGSLGFNKWACMFVCLIEISSIISNILRPKGYNIDFLKTLVWLCQKVFGASAAQVIREVEELPNESEDSTDKEEQSNGDLIEATEENDTVKEEKA